jgi:hypothetical protein
VCPDRRSSTTLNRLGTGTQYGLVATGVWLLAAYLVAMTVVNRQDRRIVVGDATHHFVQLRSLVFDHDLDFRNEYIRLYGLNGEVPGTEWIFTDLTGTGHVRNYMPVGPAILWAPLYLAAVAIQFVLSWLHLAPAPDGYDRALQLVPGVMGVAAATAAAVLSWRLARGLTSAPASAVAVFACWLGSHALYYSLVSPAYSHAASMLASSVLLLVWIRGRECLSIQRLAIWGGLSGLAALMRWQDAVWILVPVVEALRWRTSTIARIGGVVAAGAAFVVVFSPQMAIWAVLYGHAFALPQGPAFMQWWSPHLLAVLLSDNHGLFTWAPILLLAALGLVGLLRRHRPLALPLTLVVLAEWYTNAAVADWWAGEAFGARRFLSLFPLFVAGLASWIDRPDRPAGLNGRRVALVAALVVANGFLLLQYELFMKGLTRLAPYPHGWPDMWVTRFVVPFRLLRSWLP